MQLNTTESEKQPLCGGVLPSINHSELNEQVQLGGNIAVYVRRRSSVAKLAVERLVRTRERLWATTIFVTVSAVPALLVGYTLGFSSSALLELTDKNLPLDRQFSDLLSSLFGVSKQKRNNFSKKFCYIQTAFILTSLCNLKVFS